MKLVGVRDGSDVTVAVLLPGGVAPIAPVADFWADLPTWRPVAASATDAEHSLDDVVLAPPIPERARVLCLGLNYRAHAEEGTYGVPSHPTIFGQWTASLSVSDVPVPLPRNEDGMDWEGEVAAVVGDRLADVDAETAETAVFGHVAFKDLSARTAQKLTAQWTLGKNADRSGPISAAPGCRASSSSLARR